MKNIHILPDKDTQLIRADFCITHTIYQKWLNTLMEKALFFIFDSVTQVSKPSHLDDMGK